MLDNPRINKYQKINGIILFLSIVVLFLFGLFKLDKQFWAIDGLFGIIFVVTTIIAIILPIIGKLHEVKVIKHSIKLSPVTKTYHIEKMTFDLSNTNFYLIFTKEGGLLNPNIKDISDWKKDTVIDVTMQDLKSDDLWKGEELLPQLSYHSYH